MKFAILPEILTSLQKDVLIGSLLGDAYMQIKKGSINPRVEIGRSIKDLHYLEWQFKIFRNLCSDKEIEIRYLKHPELVKYNKNHDPLKKYGQCRFRTRNVPVFNSYYNKWYVDRFKIVPRDLELNAQNIAIWFCDDGSLYKPKGSLSISFSTDGFHENDVDFLCNLLSVRYNGNFYKIKRKSYSDKNNFEIRVCAKASLKLIEDVHDFIPTSMERKLKHLK